ncbi:MAG: hypothetical protein U1F25_16820 [Rubrivivax sp.]
MREQLAKVLGNLPSADIDPLGDRFEAVPGNGMDDLIAAIQRGLDDGARAWAWPRRRWRRTGWRCTSCRRPAAPAC